MQRLEQMHVVPDVLPYLNPVADISIKFGRHTIQPGAFVESRISERPAKLSVQLMESGEKLVTIAVIDADVPNIETDMFEHRCHFLASNVSLSPTSPDIALANLEESQVVFPWMPPHAQKGSPYHRLAILIMEQPGKQAIDVKACQEKHKRLGFNLRGFNNQHKISPLTGTLFRNIWDESTKAVMERTGLEGADIELKPKKPEALPYKKKDGSRYR